MGETSSLEVKGYADMLVDASKGCLKSVYMGECFVVIEPERSKSFLNVRMVWMRDVKACQMKTIKMGCVATTV